MPHDPRAQQNGHKLDLARVLERREKLLIGLALEKLFFQANGRRGEESEIAEWMEKQDWTFPLDPYAVLTAEEITAFDSQNH